jgi:phosphoribosylaminoimidazole-succinocarboxamide synthase
LVGTIYFQKIVQEKIYEGKAKILYKSENPDEIFQYFKDDATAFNNVKKDTLASKGILNNYISEFIMHEMSANGIENHFIERLDERVQKVKKLEIIPLEVIVRNRAAGSICKRIGLEEGKVFKAPLTEFCYKEDKFGDPVINDEHITNALECASEEEVAYLKKEALKVNQVLIKLFANAGIDLIDFKIEFGRNNKGEIMLADEISPDSCRLWDQKTGEKMDKDRFRLDLGDVTKFYAEIAKRLNIKVNL